MTRWNKLTGKNVIVRAMGLTYTGVLIEINETSVVLRAPTGHREIMLVQVNSIEEGEERSSLPPSPLKGL